MFIALRGIMNSEENRSQKCAQLFSPMDRGHRISLILPYLFQSPYKFNRPFRKCARLLASPEYKSLALLPPSDSKSSSKRTGCRWNRPGTLNQGHLFLHADLQQFYACLFETFEKSRCLASAIRDGCSYWTQTARNGLKFIG